MGAEPVAIGCSSTDYKAKSGKKPPPARKIKIVTLIGDASVV
jgi:hypothetical protein